MSDLPDLNTPLPDLAHESLRRAAAAAVEQLADHIEQLGDAFLLSQTAADGLAIALTNFLALQEVIAGQAQQIADLEARVKALEPAPDPSPASADDPTGPSDF